MVYYLNPNNAGISFIGTESDGSTLTLKWYRAFPNVPGNLIAYNIYLDTELPTFEIELFKNSPAFVSVDGKLQTSINDLTPGQIYRAAVRPVEYDAGSFDLRSELPTTFNNLRVYPESPLREDITTTSDIVPLLSVDGFPDSGVVKVGAELIQYTSVDTVNNNLELSNIALQRGYRDTDITVHDTDGYDGYVQWSPIVLLFPVSVEDQNTVVFSTQSRFDYPHYAFTLVDGYRQATKDIVNTDLSSNDALNEDFPSYDYAGYHRTDPVALFNGECVGSYFGGEMGCVDGYSGVGMRLRGISVDDRNTQRQEVLLSLIGEPVCLVKRVWTGIYCYCVLATNEQPDARCPTCNGTGRVVGYSQYFNPRSSDGRIQMRFDPWIDDAPLQESGLSVEAVKPNAWTLTVPGIKKRDFIVRFDAGGNEEYRYEVLNLSRNVLFSQNLGAQKLSLQRIRKSDPIYMTKVFRDTSTMPTVIQTNIASSLGIPPHSHSIVRNEKHPSTWQQNTSVNQAHSHILSWNSSTGLLEVSEELGHNHILVY